MRRWLFLDAMTADVADLIAQAGAALAAGQPERFIALCRRVIALRPDYAEAHSNLGAVLHDLGRFDQAVEAFGQALALKPGHAQAHANLGASLNALCRFEEAATACRRAIGLSPGMAEAHCNLGVALRQSGALAAAADSFQRAVTLAPDFAEAHNNLASLLRETGRLEPAIVHYRRALTLRPDYAEAHNGLGGALLELGRFDEAIACCGRALAFKPDFAVAHCTLGTALMERGRLDPAAACFVRAIELAPDYASAHGNLGNLLKDQGRIDQAIACCRQACELMPDSAAAHSNLLFSQNYQIDPPRGRARDDLARFGRLVSAKASAPFTTWLAPAAPERLRVGLVSGDLGNHPVGYFLDGLLRAIDPAAIELVAYPTSRRAGDDLTARLNSRCARWTPLVGLDDQAAARRIHADGVHILLDLSGHTAHNRLPLFGWRPAPVQVTWLGYFASTGMVEIDYILADAIMIPPEEEADFTEKVWRLPETHWCFTPPDGAPELAPPSALASGAVTFASFNNLAKLNDAVVALWARVLRALPDARLLLKAKQLREAGARDETRRRFAAHGVVGARLILEGPIPRAEMLNDYNRVDIALDPFPFPGGTTSVEGLWMGVPMVTRRGDRFVAHQGESIARNAGLADWIATDDDDYLAKAIAHASDIPRLAALRADLRRRLSVCPLFDAPRFARHFEAALWGMWRASGR